MRLSEILTKALQYTSWLAIAFQDGHESPHAPTFKVLNVTGTTNSSFALNETVFNASEISKFTIANVSTTFASAITLPISLLPVFESATAASELRSALSTATLSTIAISTATNTIQILTSLIVPESHGTLGRTNTASTSTAREEDIASGPIQISTFLVPERHGTLSKTNMSSNSSLALNGTFFNVSTSLVPKSPGTSNTTNWSYSTNHTFNVSLATPGFVGNYSSLSRPRSCHGLICNEVRVQNSSFDQVVAHFKSSVADSVGLSSIEKQLALGAIDYYCSENDTLMQEVWCKDSAAPNGLLANGIGVSTGTSFNYTIHFNHLNDQTIFKDDENISDMDYFELTPENLRDSLVLQWYSSWTVIAQHKQGWEKHGEWGSFWREYLHEPNFKCPTGFASCNYQPPSIGDIRRRFPGNRVLGRRVLFTTLLYDIMHQYTNELDTMFRDTELRFQTMIPDIIKVFTLQVDDDKAAYCQIIKQLVQTVINVVIDVGVAIITDGIGSVFSNKLLESLEGDGRMVAAKFIRHIEIKTKLPFNPEMKRKIIDFAGKLTSAYNNQAVVFPFMHIPQQWLAFFYHSGTGWGQYMSGHNDLPEWHNERENEARPEDAAHTNYDQTQSLLSPSLLNDAYRAWPRKKLEEFNEEQVQSGRSGTLEKTLPTIIGGSGSGWICSDFEGDWQDHNKENRNMLKDRVAVELEGARRQVWTMFKAMYDGAVLEEGRPSMLARWMISRNWVGKDDKGTVEYDLHHVEDFHKKFELTYVKDLASSALASGYNYLKCSHRQDAVEKCSNEGVEYQQLFCPEPEMDPTLVCQTARWYFSETEPHEIDMVATNSVEQFGAMHGFKFSREGMLAQIWENWKRFGNRAQSDRIWGKEALSGPTEETKHPHGFRLPVCVSEDNRYDVHHHQILWWKNWNFPVTCGNHAANESADFMKAMTLQPGSPKHSNTDWTFRDRVPRALWHKAPYTVYMSMCEMGLRWPNKDHDDTWFLDRYTLKTSPDKTDSTRDCGKKGMPSCTEDHNPKWGDQDCALVKSKTLHMDQSEANLAFCANTLGHTIFKRQAPRIWASMPPLGAWLNQEHHCGKWLEKNGMKALETISRRTLEAAEKGTHTPMYDEKHYEDEEIPNPLS